MPTALDLATWPRRAAFDHFRAFDAPWFGVCTRVDVTRLKPALAAACAAGTLGTASVSLACHYLALRMANEVDAFRLRLAGSVQAPQVHLHECVHAATTVLREDDSFAFAQFDYDPDFGRFAPAAAAAMAAARADRAFEPRPGNAAVIHITTLPWVHFSSFTHARHPSAAPSVPKIAFGRIDAEPARLAGPPRLWMPLAVDVHHALMDGLHVGRFVQGFEALLQTPAVWLPGAGQDPAAGA